MNRIDNIFQQLRASGQKALMPFLTAGDPDLETTGALLIAAEQAGASVCEIGFPFSDPIADGPVIQASMTHALEHGVDPSSILEMVARVRSRLDIGIVAMVSYSIVARIGIDTFLKDAGSAGIDGFIFPDLPLEESLRCGMLDRVSEHGMICSQLISPTTPDDRAIRIARASSGFIYLLSRSGITGERTQLPEDLKPRVDRLRDVTDLPIAVGFGISSHEQVRAVTRIADAAIVGSGIMRRVAEYRSNGSNGTTNGSARGGVIEQVGGYIRELAAGLDPNPPVGVSSV